MLDKFGASVVQMAKPDPLPYEGRGSQTARLPSLVRRGGATQTWLGVRFCYNTFIFTYKGD
jgi:hypothetical protein